MFLKVGQRYRTAEQIALESLASVAGEEEELRLDFNTLGENCQP